MRRKGELSPSRVDALWPHQVALPESFNLANFVAIRDFITIERLSIGERGHTFYCDDQFYIVYCFAESEHAERFRARFGGEMIPPKDRPKWGGGKRKRA